MPARRGRAGAEVPLDIQVNQYEYEENDELTLDDTEEESSDEEHYEEPEEGEEGEDENSHFFEPENGQKTGKNGVHNPSVETQFKPGNAGGPGRPRKPKTLKAIIRRWLFAGSEEDARRVLDMLFEKAIAGNLTAIRLLLEHSKPDKDRAS